MRLTRTLEGWGLNPPPSVEAPTYPPRSAYWRRDEGATPESGRIFQPWAGTRFPQLPKGSVASFRRKKAVVRVRMSSESTLTHDRHDRLGERGTGYSVTPHTMA
jgi:hypothetical protein